MIDICDTEAENTIYHESFTEEKFRGFMVSAKLFYTNCFEYGGTSINPLAPRTFFV